MTKKLDVRILLSMLLIMMCLTGCNVSNSEEEVTEEVIEKPVEKSINKKTNESPMISEQPAAKQEKDQMDLEEDVIFDDLYIYQFPKTTDGIFIPDSWEKAYGIIESSDSVLFVHNNTIDVYAPLMEVKTYETEDEWRTTSKQSNIENDGFYAKLGESGEKIYGAKVFSISPYGNDDLDNPDLASQYHEMTTDLAYIFLTFNHDYIVEAMTSSNVEIQDASLFKLQIADHPATIEDKEAVALVSATIPAKNGQYASRYGYINKFGQYVVSPIYDTAEPFKEGLAIVSKNNRYGVIDNKGNVVLELKYDLLKNYGEGYLVYSVNGTGTEGYIDLEGNILVPAQFSEASAFKEGKALIRDTKDLYGYIDTTGQIVVPTQYKAAKSYNDGVALVSSHDKNFYIDGDGDIILELNKFKNDPENFVATDFVNDVAFKKVFPSNADYWAPHAFKSNNNRIEWAMIDKNGRLITRTYFRDINHPVPSEKNSTNQLISVKNNWKLALLDTEGNIVFEPQYDDISVNPKNYTVIKNERAGILDKDFKIILPPVFDAIGKFNNGYASASLSGVKFIISENGEIVWHQVAESDDVLSNIVKIPFELESLHGADLLKLFNYELKDFQQAFEGQYVIGPSGPDGSYIGLFFESEQIEMVFTDEGRPSYIGLGNYADITRGTKLDKVLETLGETKLHHFYSKSEDGVADVDQYELDYNVDGHFLSFISKDKETVSEIIIFDLEESTSYLKNIEEELNDNASVELDFTLVKEDTPINLTNYDRDFIIAKSLEDKSMLYFDLESLVQLLGGQCSVDDKTGKVRIDCSGTTYYYSNEFWQNKNGNYLREGDGTILEDGHYYLEGNLLYAFFDYRVLWQRDTNEITINPESNNNGHYPTTEVPANKMVVYVREGSGWLEGYAETFVVESVSEIYERYPDVIPREPNTEGNFVMEIYHNYVAEEAADYMVVSDGYDRNYYLEYEGNESDHDGTLRIMEGSGCGYDGTIRLKEGENLLEHHFHSYLPKTLSLKKCPPYISEEALIIQLKDEVSTNPKVVYVIDPVNDDGNKCTVNIAPSDEPIVLCLASFNPIKWSINNPDNVVIEAILYSQGIKREHRPIVKGDIDDIPIYYTDKLVAVRKILLGNQPVTDNYKYDQGDIERATVKLDLQVQKIFGVRPYSLSYMDRDKKIETDQVIWDESFYDFFDPIVERVLEIE